MLCAALHTPLCGVAPALSAEGVPLVMSMQLTRARTSGDATSAKIYAALSEGRSIQEAVHQARQALYFEEDDGCSWYLPTLYIRSREGGPVYV